MYLVMAFSIIVLINELRTANRSRDNAQDEVAALRAEAAKNREQIATNQEVLLEVIKAKDRKIEQLNSELAARTQGFATATREDIAAEATELKKLQEKLRAAPNSSVKVGPQNPSASNQPAPTARTPLKWGNDLAPRPAAWDEKLSFRPICLPYSYRYRSSARFHWQGRFLRKMAYLSCKDLFTKSA